MKIIGHRKQLAFLTQAMALGRLAHGLCFVGPERVGKRAVAFWLAGELLKIQDPERHADFFFVTRERDEKTDILKYEIGIEQIRRLREQLGQSSFFSGSKIAVIDEAEKLSTAATNALLKTLEEPPGKSMIVLITRALEEMPATIASRVQVVRFQPVTIAEMVASGVEEEYAKLAVGRPGIAFGLRDPEILERYEHDLVEFKELLGAPVWKRAKIIEGWFGKKKAHAEGISELQERLRLWRTVLREDLLAKAGVMGDNMRNAHEMLQRLARLEELVAANSNVRYAIEATFLI